MDETRSCMCRTVTSDNDSARWLQTNVLFDHVFGPIRNKETESAFTFLHAFLEKNHSTLNNTQLAWFFTFADRRSYSGLNANTFNYMLMSAIISNNQRMLCSLFSEANTYFPELNDNPSLTNKDYGDIYQIVLGDLGHKLAVYSEAQLPEPTHHIFKTISVYTNDTATTLRSRGVVVYTETIKLERITEQPDWMKVKFNNSEATEIFKEVVLYKSSEGTPFNKLLGALAGDQINPETGKAFPGSLIVAMEGSFSKELKMYLRYLQILEAQQVAPSPSRVI